MKRSSFRWVPLLLAFLFFLTTGCGTISGAENKKDEEKKTAQTEKEKTANSNPIEIKFRDLSSRMPWKSEGGIWLFTKEDHPGNAADLVYDWDEYDVLLVQLGDKKHYGYELQIISVQLMDAETAKITVYLNRTSDVGTENASPARAFIRVDRGVFQFKKFIIETEDGDKLSTK